MLEALHEISIAPTKEEERFGERTLPDSVPTPNPTEQALVSAISDRGPISGSSASMSSFASSAVLSERDAETEEDEGMILVGRAT
jgi:hypothetical protein